MKTVIAFLIPLLFFVCSCNQHTKQPPGAAKPTNKRIAPRITLLANLPDSSQPVRTFLKDVPAPKTTRIRIPPKVHSFMDPLTKKPLPPESQGQGHFTNFTTEQGLASDNVSCSITDKTGNIWFGTLGGGVSRFDGKKFVNYTTAQGLIHNIVRCITTDKKGNLWFGTDGGISKYDGEKFINYSTKQGLANNTVFSILEDKTGHFWIGTFGGGISRFDRKKFTNYTTKQGLANDQVMCILQDKTENIWFATFGGGISRYDGKKFVNYTTREGLTHNEVVWIMEDTKGNLWFGTDGGGVSRFDGKKFTNYTTKQGLAHNDVMTITEDKTGNIWITTFGGGVNRFDGKSFINYTTAQGLANNFVNNTLEDKTGSLWFGTFSGGISRYDGASCINYTTKQGLAANNIVYIMEDKKRNLWFGSTGGGVSRYDGKSFINYTTKQGLVYDIVTSIIEDKTGDIWFGTTGNGGLSKLNLSSADNHSFTNFTTRQGLANNFIVGTLKDDTGILWFGTFDGVSKLTLSSTEAQGDNSFTNFTTRQGLANNLIRSIGKGNGGNIWFGTEGGVSRYDGKSFTNFTTTDGLPNNTVFCILKDKAGNIWFGTDNGLSRYDGKSFTNFTTAEGLPANEIYSLIHDSDSNIVIGTRLGIGVLVSFSSKLSRDKTRNRVVAQNALSNEALKNYKPQIEIYNTATGYPIKEVNTLCKDSKGIIWIATASDKTGLVRFDYSAIHKNSDPPTLVLQSLKINNESIGWQSLRPESIPKKATLDSTAIAPNITEEVTTFGKELSKAERDSMRHRFGEIQFDGVRKWYPIPENLVLPYKNNSITIDFAAIETIRPSMVNYQYILEGYDEDWSPKSNKTFANFGNMSEGVYTFKLKAQSPFGVWSQPLIYSFRVLPPWWRTWWAYLLYLSFFSLMLGSAVWRFITYRSRELQRKNRALEEKVHALEEIKDALLNGQKIERRRVAADLHDNLGGMMSAIRLSIEAIDTSELSPKEKEVYENVLNMTRQAYNDVRLLAHNLQPEELEKFGLPEALQRLMHKLNDSQPILFSVITNALSRLSKELEFNLYSICLELANNIVKHSQATEATFEFVPKNDQLQLFVTDNGQGFIPNNTSDGMGMRNIQERTQQMGGTLKIHSQPGEGTMFLFSIPFTPPTHASRQT